MLIFESLGRRLRNSTFSISFNPSTTTLLINMYDKEVISSVLWINSIPVIRFRVCYLFLSNQRKFKRRNFEVSQFFHYHDKRKHASVFSLEKYKNLINLDLKFTWLLISGIKIKKKSFLIFMWVVSGWSRAQIP